MRIPARMGHTKISGVGPAVLAKARSIHSIFDYHATARGGWCLLRLAPQRRGRVMAPSSIACIGKPSPHHGFEHSAPGATMPIEHCPQPLRDCCPNSLETSRISLAPVQKLCRCWSRRQKLVETNWHSPRSLSTLLSPSSPARPTHVSPRREEGQHRERLAPRAPPSSSKAGRRRRAPPPRWQRLLDAARIHRGMDRLAR